MVLFTRVLPLCSSNNSLNEKENEQYRFHADYSHQDVIYQASHRRCNNSRMFRKLFELVQITRSNKKKSLLKINYWKC